MIPVSRPEVTDADIEAVTQALRETQISGEASPVKQLEQSLADYLGVQHAMAVSNGTCALDISFEAMGLGTGSKVIVPNFTIISSVSNLLRRGVEITTIDSDSETWSMNADETEAAITEDIDAVLAVHIYGLPVDMQKFQGKAQKLEIPVIEDSAESLGLEYFGKKCGTFGEVSTYSFFANKIVTGGEGGAITTNNEKLASEIKSLRNLYHSNEERFVHHKIGWNARMHALSAALANSQLERIDLLRNKKRQTANKYLDGLRNHPWFTFQPPSTSYAENDYWVFGILLNSDAPYSVPEFRELLKGKGVDTRRFFCPLSLQPLASQYGIKSFNSSSISEELWKRGVYLPSGNGITELEIEKVIDVLWNCVK
jgi:perosamine synthetase